MFIDYDGHNRKLIKDLVYTDFTDGDKVYEFCCKYKDFVKTYYDKDLLSMSFFRGVEVDFTPLGYNIRQYANKSMPVFNTSMDKHLKMFVEEGNDFYWSHHFHSLLIEVVSSSIIEFCKHYMDDEERIEYYVEATKKGTPWLFFGLEWYFLHRFRRNFQKDDIKNIEKLLTDYVNNLPPYYQNVVNAFFCKTLPYTKEKAEEVIGRNFKTSLPSEMDDDEFTLLEFNGLI